MDANDIKNMVLLGGTIYLTYATAKSTIIYDGFRNFAQAKRIYEELPAGMRQGLPEPDLGSFVRHEFRSMMRRLGSGEEEPLLKYIKPYEAYQRELGLPETRDPLNSR